MMAAGCLAAVMAALCATVVVVSAQAPDPPFAPSTLITSATFQGPAVHWTSGQGDTWPTTMVSDDLTVGWCCDNQNSGAFSPMSLYSVQFNKQGEPAPTLISANPIPYAELCSYLGPTGTYPLINVKPGSLIG